MSASYVFSASCGIRQFWVVLKDDLGQLRAIRTTTKGPEKGSFIHFGSGDALLENIDLYARPFPLVA
jgi:hypothetical protein